MEQQNAADLENSKWEKSQSSKSKHRVFKIVRKHFATIGITPNSTDRRFSGTILFGFLMLGSAIYCISVFIIYDAEKFAEYSQSVYMVSGVAFILFILLLFIFKVENLFEFINGCDALVNTSESDCKTQFTLRKFHIISMFFVIRHKLCMFQN